MRAATPMLISLVVILLVVSSRLPRLVSGAPYYTAVCNGKPYNQVVQLCCDGILYEQYKDVACCGKLAYREAGSICCVPNVVLRRGAPKTCDDRLNRASM
ncbi:hypothetical protein LSAT2_031256 [Lamellibrachia satsuma]|nr:hypothetical protein LSAT2_031256 [Lamellibrachia satsuma]